MGRIAKNSQNKFFLIDLFDIVYSVRKYINGQSITYVFYSKESYFLSIVTNNIIYVSVSLNNHIHNSYYSKT